MSVLLIGSGGREHALAWALVKSRMVPKLFCAPGNAGMATVGECVDLDIDDHDAVFAFCVKNQVGFVVIGPEGPLVAGLADDLRAHGIGAFGPSAAAARLEGSKSFTKELCAANNIPTAGFGSFDNASDAKAYLDGQKMPIVIKADGLAAGKGVIIAQTLEQAMDAVDLCFGGNFGEAGAKIIIEEFLVGEEASYFALCDGEHIMELPTAQDHKAAYDGDRGPNTGGMGAYTPAPVMSEQMRNRVMSEIIEPTVKAMKEAGTPFQGVLYAGVIITDEGPKLIEYNVRFGDPECQALLMRLTADIVPLLMSCQDGKLHLMVAKWSDDKVLTVVMANKGYPGSYEKGSVIKGLEAAGADPDVEIFHAGTALEDGNVVAVGGRVLNITARGASVREAQERVYAAIAKIDWPEGFYRKDIGWRAIEREDAEVKKEQV